MENWQIENLVHMYVLKLPMRQAGLRVVNKSTNQPS